MLSGLAVSVAPVHEVCDVPAPAETGATFAANARAKALYYARACGQWCLADDSGLEVDALDGRPGVYSARYAADRVDTGADRPAYLAPAYLPEVGREAGRQTLDRANNIRLLADLDGVEDARRTARFVCHLALADPRRLLLEACGTVDGRIAREPSGDNGFGYDPLFYLPELGCTAAELSARQKNRISHRGKAVRRLAELLGDYLADRS